MQKKMIIGVMGPGEGATSVEKETALQLGKMLGESGFHVLTGGRAVGVMEAAMKGAKSAGGTTIGILPSADGSGKSNYVDISINTGMGSARNNINVLTADIVVGIGIGAGTTSEIALAIKAQKPVVLLNYTKMTADFFQNFNHPDLHLTNSVEDAVQIIQSLN